MIQSHKQYQDSEDSYYRDRQFGTKNINLCDSLYNLRGIYMD